MAQHIILDPYPHKYYKVFVNNSLRNIKYFF